VTQRAQKVNASPPANGIDYHQTAQLSALRALALSFSDRSASSFRLFAETFLEYVLQVFEADGAYLEFNFDLSEKLRLAIGSFGNEKAWQKVLFSKAKETSLAHHASAPDGKKPVEQRGWDPKSSSLISMPIYRENQILGVLALWKSEIPSFFREIKLEELEVFIQFLALASKEASSKKIRGQTIQDFSNHLEDGVFIIDREGQAVIVNPKGKTLIGIQDKEEAIRGLYSDPVLFNIRNKSGVLLSPDQLPLARTLRGESFSSVEYLIRRPGERREVHLSLSGGFLRNKKKEVIEGILVAREVTEYKRRERRLQLALSDQRERELARTAFLSHVSHELKTPLNVIIGYVSLLLGNSYGDLPKKAKEALSRTHVNAKQLTRMISDLLTLSQMEATKMIASLEEVNLGVVLRDVVRDARSLSDEKPIEFLLTVEEDLPLIKSDRAKIKEIFMNLFSNAVKYTPRGSIKVFAKNRPEERRIQIDVVDTGIGIHEPDLKHLFEEFHRVEDPVMKTVPGTGLGLSIVKMMVALLQGSIKVESIHGKGSTFTVFLPYTVRALV
jgi:signal transduction histidine kinase